MGEAMTSYFDKIPPVARPYMAQVLDRIKRADGMAPVTSTVLIKDLPKGITSETIRRMVAYWRSEGILFVHRGRGTSWLGVLPISTARWNTLKAEQKQSLTFGKS